MGVKETNIFRFGVKDTNGECSSVWRVWTYKNDGYLTTGHLGDQYKASFHESGKCYVGLTRELKGTLTSDPDWNGQESCFLKWQRDKEIKKNQFVLLLDIWFPSSYLDLPVEKDHPDEKEVIWIGASPKGKMVSVRVIIANIENHPDITLHNADSSLLWYRSFTNGYKFVLLYRHIDEPPGLVDSFPSYIQCALHPNENQKTYGKIDFIDIVKPNKRLLIWKIIDGSRVCIEVSPRKVIGSNGKFLVGAKLA